MALLAPHILLGSLLLVNVLFAVVSSYLDYVKSRKSTKHPLISVIMSAHNSAGFIEKSIKALYKSYPKSKLEVFVVNDASTDKTLDVLNGLKKRYGVHVSTNERNLGKSLSLNRIYSRTKGELVLIVDADTVVSKKAMDEMISRFESNPNVGGTSCRLSSINTGFLPLLQEIEYNFIAIFQGSFNHYSSIGLAGGCLMVRRKAFEQAGLLSVNAVTEDTDLAMKLNEKGWKVEQSFSQVKTIAHESVKGLYKQKMRWNAGFIQSILTHPRAYLTNPVFDFFLFTFILYIFLSITVGAQPSLPERAMGVIKEIYSGSSVFNPLYYGFIENYSITPKVIVSFLIYPLLSLPYVYLTVKRWRKDYANMLFVYPYSIVYLPFLGFMFFIGWFVGLYKYATLKKGRVGWKAGE